MILTSTLGKHSVFFVNSIFVYLVPNNHRDKLTAKLVYISLAFQILQGYENDIRNPPANKTPSSQPSLLPTSHLSSQHSSCTKPCRARYQRTRDCAHCPELAEIIQSGPSLVVSLACLSHRKHDKGSQSYSTVHSCFCNLTKPGAFHVALRDNGRFLHLENISNKFFFQRHMPPCLPPYRT